MTIQELGSIGEFVAAIATLATLLYLAIQIRQNTRSVRAASYHAINGMLVSINQSIAENAEVARIEMIGGDDPTALSDEERRRFAYLLANRFRLFDSLYYQFRLGLLEERMWKAYRRVITQYLSQPGVAVWWRSGVAGGYQDTFVAEVDSLLDRAESRVDFR